ncbi:MAG: hypothetical protein EOP59_11640 [Sphingomonadales bacterium]|nr:MAG: hypothetical protein EOP59_11640 [Sphingomonadales bacterium]
MAWLKAIGVWLVLACALAGCGAKPERADIDPEQLNAIATAGPTVAEVLARGNDSATATPAITGFGHLGRWAASRGQCRAKAWVFAADRVTVPGEEGCRVTKSEVVAERAKKLALACTTRGLTTIESWSLVQREYGSMTVARTEGGNGIPRSTTLKRCDGDVAAR